MPYCEDCSINYQSDDVVCASCGNKLTIEPEAEKVSAPPDFDESQVENTRYHHRNGIKSGPADIVETHIGKGLIKPNLVEQDLEGFHFKYDKPLSNFVKAETYKDKVVEFRVTCPDTETEESGKKNEPASIIQPLVEGSEPVLGQQMPEMNPKTESIGSSIVNNRVEPSTDENEWIAGEISGDAIDGINLELESTGKPILPEPELKTTDETEEVEVLWEDTQKWLGISLSKQYRITNRSLQIIDGANRRFSEVDISLISDVQLQQSWLGKLFGIGTLVISVSNLPGSKLLLTGLRNPERVLHLLEELLKL